VALLRWPRYRLQLLLLLMVAVVRDVNLIFSFFNVYAVISKLFDITVYNLVKMTVLHTEYVETVAKTKK
jgi:hypothetical protein